MSLHDAICCTITHKSKFALYSVTILVGSFSTPCPCYYSPDFMSAKATSPEKVGSKFTAVVCVELGVSVRKHSDSLNPHESRIYSLSGSVLTTYMYVTAGVNLSLVPMHMVATWHQ